MTRTEFLKRWQHFYPEKTDARADLHALLNAERADLAEALRDLVDLCFDRPGENAIDRFERVAEEFRRDTGFLRPGKSVPLAMGGSNEEERDAAWRAWSQKRLNAMEDRARAALSRAGVSEGE